MMQIQEIEKAIRELPNTEKKSLALRLNDLYWDAWDEQMEDDYASGKLNSLIAEAEKDIAEGKTKPLDEVIRGS